MQNLILVDNDNRAIGVMPRQQAHTSPGKLHRAFSIYVFRKNGTELLIQKRHPSKLWGKVWANSCCSHPREGEEITDVAPRRLKEELGFSCALTPIGEFVYQAEDPRGKGAEHEHVTVFRGDSDDEVTVSANPEEVAEWKWVKMTDLQNDMKKNPDDYAPWFHVGLKNFLKTN